MLLIPSLELRGGRVVDNPEDPIALATRLVAAGVLRLQVVDLDGAQAGHPVQQALIARLVAACPGVPLQVAGGVRSEDGAQQHLDAGAQFVVLDTRAATQPHLVQDLCLEFPTHVLVALEAHAGKLAAEHWSKHAQHSLLEVAQQLEREGVAAVVHAERDGGAGAASAALARGLQVPVFDGSGLRLARQVTALKAAQDDGVAGALLAPACLAAGFDLAALLRAAR